MLDIFVESTVLEHEVYASDHFQPLISKFIPSLPKSSLQIRTRLLRLLEHGLRCPLTLISAPAGFGKTTLLSQWVTSLVDRGLSVAWVSLDEYDNTPSRFWHALLTSLTQQRPAFDSLRGTGSTATLLTLFINACAAQQEPLVIMLDDYHTITNSIVQGQMAYLLERLPPHIHIVISTRVDPELPLARMRAHNCICEVRMHHLRFSYEEALVFLQKTLQLSLTPAQFEYLINHTDGWIAGLRLASSALYKLQPTENILLAVHGGQRHILDYILEEVLSTQPEYIQTFLLKTAILSRFSASLCDAVLDQQDSWQVLQQLERANLFLIPEDHEHRWYHYQTLFAEALASNIQRAESSIVRTLHQRAAHWYQQHGFLMEAVEHLCKAEEWEQAASLLEQLVPHPDHRYSETAALTQVQAQLVRLPRMYAQLQAALDARLTPKTTEGSSQQSPYAENGEQQERAARHTHPLQSFEVLSLRELEVLQLIAQGASNAEIADQLVIATGTVKRHISNIFSKLKASNRTQAVAYARQQGVL